MKTNQLKRAIIPLVIAASVTAVGLSAAEPPPQEKIVSEESTDDALKNSEGERPPKATPARKKKVDNDLDRQLLRDLLPDLPIEPESVEEESDDAKTSSPKPQSRLPFADELDETVAAMREVSLRLDKLNLSDDTEQLQTGIVSNIDELIEKLKNLPPPSSSSSENPDNDQSDSDSQSQSQGQKKEPQSKPQQSSEKQNSADTDAGATSRPQQGKSGESTEQNRRQARERAAALARRRAMIDEVWGHLPPAMRERLLNVGSEKLLPKYEDLIRRYYEALAEPDNPGSRR